MPKVRNYGKNLGKYLHKAKTPSGAKVGSVKRTSPRRKKQMMKTPKGI